MAENTGLNNEAEHHPGDASTSAPAVRAKGNRLRQAGLAILAVVFLALLVDTAVETYLGEAEIRWWVTGTVVAYLILTAILYWKIDSVRQRLGWAGSAALSLLVFLALMVFAASQPDGFSQGIRLLGQSTSAVYSAVIAIAIAASALILLRLVAFHPVLSLAIGALATYGIAAFVYGIVTNTPFVDLFAGESLWQSLPFWLQGPFVGGLLLIACALLYQIVHGILKVRGAELRAFGVKVLCLMLSLSLALQGSYLTPPQSTGLVVKQTEKRETRPNGSDADAQLTREETLEKLDNLFNALEAAEKEIPRDTFDPQAIIDEVGKDPVKLFEWVRDNTVLVPYQGVLRGHMGVLMDRMGNSLDRALLLHKLLTLSGHGVRLAQGQLTNDMADNLLADSKALQLSKREAIWPGVRPSSGATAYRQDGGAEGPRPEKSLPKIQEEYDQVLDSTVARANEQTLIIFDAIGMPDFAKLPTEPVKQRIAIADHWWVQLYRDGAWQDLDPFSAETQPGQQLTEPITTSQPDEIAENLIHTVQIRVILEWSKNGELSEEIVLNHNIDPAHSLGLPITLAHVPMGAAYDDLRFFNSDELTKTWKELITSELEWLPVLRLGQEPIFDSSFNVHGLLVDVKNPDAVATRLGIDIGKTTENVVDKVGDLFESLPTEPVDAEKAQIKEQGMSSNTQLTAEWIEYEIQSPGHSPKVIRRPVFDLIGPSSRIRGAATNSELTAVQNVARAEALIGQTIILPLANHLSREYVLDLYLNRLIENEAIIRDVFAGSYDIKTLILRDQLWKLSSLPGPVFLLASNRSIEENEYGRTFVDRPNVFNFFSVPNLDEQGMPRLGFDIVYNDVGVTALSRKDRFLARMYQGTLDTNLELQVIRLFSPRFTHNTSALFEQSHNENSWVVIGETKDSVLQDLTLDDDDLARIASCIAEGYIVFTPKEPLIIDGRPYTGWWQVNPLTGHTLGVGADGRGVSFSDYLTNLYWQALRVAYTNQSFWCATYITLSVGDAMVKGGLRVPGMSDVDLGKLADIAKEICEATIH